MSTVPVFTIYVRHSTNCPYRDDEFFKRCTCWKHIRWFGKEPSDAKPKPHRIKTKQRTWAGAERVKAEMRAARDGSAVAGEEVQVTVAQAVDMFLAEKIGQELSASVTGKYRRELDRLRLHLETQGIFRLQDVRLTHLTTYRAKWPELYPGSLTRSKVQERLKAFFKYATLAYNLPRNPVAGLGPLKAQTPPTIPLSLDEEYPALLKASNEFRPPMNQRIRALVQLQRWSGLAVQDACCFERAALRRDADGNGFVKGRRAKTGVEVEIPIPADVAAELEALPNSNPKYFFWAGGGKKSTVAGRYSAAMKRLFEKAGVDPGDTVMKSHRLRDTFAAYYLGEKKFALEAVAEMLGHNPTVTRKHYDHWVQGRQDALNKEVIASWAKK